MSLHSLIHVVSKEDLNKIHDASMEVLATVGVEINNKEALSLFKENKAELDGNRVLIPASLVEKAIESAPSSFPLFARDKDKTITIGEGQQRTHVEPSNGCVYAQDLSRGRRLATLADLVDFIKLAQESEVCTINGGIPVEPSDLETETGYLKIFQETLRHTDKPLRSNSGSRQQIKNMFSMFEIAMGTKGYLQNHPSIYASVNPLSPLAFDDIPLEAVMTYAQHNQPVTVLSCSLAGVSAPLDLPGAAVLQNCEILAGLVLTQLTRKGCPFIYAPAAAVPDMQTARYITGSPESNLINLTNIQLARDLYRLPTRTMAGLTDAKALDAQAGFETMQNLFECMVGGVSIINECLGVLDSIMTNSYEKFVIDEEMISRVLRFMEGIDCVKENLAVDIIRTVGPRGTFLTQPSTMQKCRSSWRPTVSNWQSYDKWAAGGELEVAQAAGRKVQQILANCKESYLAPEAEEEINAFVKNIEG